MRGLSISDTFDLPNLFGHLLAVQTKPCAQFADQLLVPGLLIGQSLRCVVLLGLGCGVCGGQPRADTGEFGTHVGGQGLPVLELSPAVVSSVDSCSTWAVARIDCRSADSAL